MDEWRPETVRMDGVPDGRVGFTMLEVSSTGPQSDVMARITGLVDERRRLLRGSQNHAAAGIRPQQRIRQMDSELEYLWLRRRAELNARQFATGWLGEGLPGTDGEPAAP